MIKKISTLIILLALFFSVQNIAFGKKAVINLAEKLDYVNMEFWNSFQDEYLTCYIKSAVKNNPDARKASWTVEENRQNVKISFARELPHVAVRASYLGLHVPQLDNFELSNNAFVLPFTANWELDLLLKNRDKTRSAKKIYEASKEQERGIYISLASSVATTYFNILKYDKMIELQEIYVKNLQNVYNRTLNQFSQGMVNATKKNDIKTELEQAKSDLADLKSNRDTSLNHLATLIGDSPNNTACYKRSNVDKYYGIIKVPTQISSDVIYSRPDVLAVEKKLEAAKIDVRVARKELLPSFNLTGIWAFNTISPGTFFSWESSLAYLIASASQDIFAGGKKIASLKAYKAKYEQMFEEYKKTDLTALKEINNALCYLKNDNEILISSMKKSINEKDNFERTKNRYNVGIISVMDYLKEYNSLINIQKNLVTSQTVEMIDYITLYKAAGGKL